jgi:hypothetical protein
MHEKNFSSQNHNPKPKGYYLPHYQGSDSPSAMRHPAWDELPEQLPDLAMVQPMGERTPSDPEIVRLVQAYNQAPGRLPETPSGKLLESLSGADFDGHETPLASVGAQDENSNGIIYLRHDKFVHAGDLRDFTNGRNTPKGGRPSSQVIAEYRNKPYDTMPPIQHVIAYYEEKSGNTFYSLTGNGTHRLAARRGDEYIPATSVSFIRLDTNSISERLEQLSSQDDEPKRRRFGRGMLHRLGVRMPRER